MTRPIHCLAVLALACGLPLDAGDDRGCPGSPSAPAVNEGVRAFKQQRYGEAVARFRTAVELDGACIAARLYLATAYMQQYIPGADSPDNQQFADSAREQFQAVLEREPDNELALASMASLFFNQKKLDDAAIWYKRLILINPQNKEAFYFLAVIAWSRAFKPLTEARQKLGMKPDDPGPLKDEEVRQALRAKNLTPVQEGLDNLDQAVALDAGYDDAIAYLNLLWRVKADLKDSPEDYRADIARADGWVQRAIETRNARQERQQ